MSGKIQYANWWSKLLFQKAYENQFVIPIPPHPFEVKVLQWLEKIFLRPNISTIKIVEPIFIVGLPRSGTSVLYNTLCAHPEAAFVTTSVNSFPEAIVGMEWLRKKLNLNIRGERFLQDSIEADFGSPSEPAVFWGKWMGRTTEELNWEDHPVTLSHSQREVIYRDVKLMQYAFGDRGTLSTQKRFICKYPVFQTELLTLQEIFPDAHFVHIVRDGRMVANSLVKLNRLVNEQIQKIKHPNLNSLIPYPRVRNLEKYIREWGADDIRTTAHIWKDSIEVVRKAQPKLRNFHEVRYEDLLIDPAGNLGHLIRKLKLNAPRAEDHTFHHELSLWGKTHHQNKYGKFDVVESVAGDTLKSLGYI